MWIATNFGFYSVVKRHEKTIRAGDTRELQIRGRNFAQMMRIRAYIPNGHDRDIIRLVTADYEFRIFVSYDEWARIMAHLVYKIDYSNFKSSVNDPALHSVYLRIWAAVQTAYDKRPRIQQSRRRR